MQLFLRILRMIYYQVLFFFLSFLDLDLMCVRFPTRSQQMNKYGLSCLFRVELIHL